MMESEQIRQMADAIIDVTGFVEGGPAKIYKHYNAVLGQSIIIYVSNDEPTRVLPLNVLWLDTNRDRSTYKQFVRRVAKVPSNGFRNTWELVTEFMRLFIAQSYDPQDGTPGLATSVSQPKTLRASRNSRPMPSRSPHRALLQSMTRA